MPDILTFPASWQVILTLSQQMLDMAEQQDWSRLAELELKRRSLLNDYFSTNASTPPEEQAQRIHGLQVIDEKLLSTCTLARDSVSGELQEMHRGKVADKAYSSHC